MGRKRQYSKAYAEYRWRYQTYSASYKKRKNFSYVSLDSMLQADDMLSELDFEIVSAQNPKLTPKDIAHKSVYGFTQAEVEARFNYLDFHDLKYKKSDVRYMSTKEFAANYVTELSSDYDRLREEGLTSTEAARRISLSVFGSP